MPNRQLDDRFLWGGSDGDLEGLLADEILSEDDNVKGGPGSGNFGHAGRPGQVGGSGGSGVREFVEAFSGPGAEDWDFVTSVPEDTVHPIEDFLGKMSSMMQGQGPEGYEYKSTFEFIHKNGKAFELGELHEGIKPMKLGECYKNAFELAETYPELTYVEGMASIHGIPLDHAWVVTKDDKVVDPTWAHGSLNRTQAHYFGVKFPVSEVRRTILKRMKYGVIHNPEMKFPLLKGKGSGEGNMGSIYEAEDTAFPSLSFSLTK